MNKDDILERSRKDNDNGWIDERFKSMQQRWGIIMVTAMMAMWLVLFLWNIVHGRETSEGRAIMMSGIAAMAFCQFYQMRMKSALVFGLLATFGAVASAVEYMLSTL